jgi:ACS family glucarate transporter-like MFS transporter
VSHAAPSAPIRSRWIILALLCVISVVTYLDRVNISVAARQMMPALGLSDLQMGRVFSAFVIGYALCQIPGGLLGDRWGARLVLAGAIVWWSAFTAMTAVAATLPLADLVGVAGSLMCVRFLMGVGEAAALPNFNRAVATWLRPDERGLGIGIAIGGIGIGSAAAPPLTAWIMVNYGWQMAFYVAGGIGLAIAALWYGYATDGPAGAAPRESAEAVPWRLFASSPTIRWLVLSYACLGYVAYIYMSWFYLYLVEVRGFNELRGAWYASAPFLAMAVLCPLGGWATDRLAVLHGVTRGRQWVGMAGMGLAAVAILLGAYSDSPTMAILLLSLGAGLLYFTVGAYWACTSDLSKTHAGTLSGVMNTGANIGGSLSPVVTPWLAGQAGWAASLGVAAAIALIGGLMWFGIKPGDGLRSGHEVGRVAP